MLNTLFAAPKPDRTLWSKMILICALGMSVCIAFMYLKSEAENPFYADAQGYVSGFYNLYNHGIYSQSTRSENLQPGIAREPGMATLLSLFATFDAGLQAIDKDCLRNASCDPELAIGAQWLNRFLFAAAGTLMFASAYLVTGQLSGAVIGGCAIWLNKHMQKNMDYVVSDPLALFLACALTLCLILVFTRRHIVWWAGSGLVLAALILTKAIFFYFTLLFVALGALVILVRWLRKKPQTSQLAIGITLLAILALTPAFAWMERNHSINGNFALSDSRAGIALNTREILNHMTPAQYFTSFLYWTRGFGDNLARDLLPKHIWDEFQIDNPQGFYLKAQLGYPKKVKEVQEATGISRIEAQKHVDRELIKAIVTNPVTHAVMTLPVIYRGLWIDQFAWFSMPFLLWLLILAYKHRKFSLFVILSPSIFNVVFYAALSLNIPRYQITAGPGLALALAMGFVILQERGFFTRMKAKITRS